MVTTTGNYNVCDANMLKALKSGAVVSNIGHFDNEIDTAFMRRNWEWEEVKPQVHKVYRDQAANDHLILLSEGRLVNLGNATGHPSRIMDGSFANQVLAQIYLYERKFANLEPEMKPAALSVEVLPKKLDEEVAAHMIGGFGAVLTRLTPEQADYINVSSTDPSSPTATSTRDLHCMSDAQTTHQLRVFPAQDRGGKDKLLNEATPALNALDPEFFSVTYGAGGSTRDTTLGVVSAIVRRASMWHPT